MIAELKKHITISDTNGFREVYCTVYLIINKIYKQKLMIVLC